MDINYVAMKKTNMPWNHLMLLFRNVGFGKESISTKRMMFRKLDIKTILSFGQQFNTSFDFRCFSMSSDIVSNQKYIYDFVFLFMLIDLLVFINLLT